MAVHVSVENQYRLLQSALAGFLFLSGCQDRPVGRHALDGLVHKPQATAKWGSPAKT